MRFGFIVAIMLALAGHTACSSDGGPRTDGNARTPLPESIATLFPDARTAATAWATMADAQRSLLVDGEVSFSDYEAAILRFATCVNDAGLVFIDDTPHYNELTKRYDFIIGPAPGTGDGSDSGPKIDACAFEHLSIVQALWHAQNRPTEVELQAADAAYRACLAEFGESADVIARVPVWGSEDWGEWYRERLEKEIQSPSLEPPAWRVCRYRVDQTTPAT